MDFKRQEKPSNGIGVVTSLFALSPALRGFFMPKKESQPSGFRSKWHELVSKNGLEALPSPDRTVPESDD